MERSQSSGTETPVTGSIGSRESLLVRLAAGGVEGAEEPSVQHQRRVDGCVGGGGSLGCGSGGGLGQLGDDEVASAPDELLTIRRLAARQQRRLGEPIE